MAWTQKEIDDVFVKVRGKAATDADFRKKLLADPNGAIAAFTGKDVPAGFRIKVIENDPAYMATFVVPDLVSDEISEDDLDKVAGGVGAAIVTMIGFPSCGADVRQFCPDNACAARVSMK